MSSMRNIPIFISSTFSDMHQERDLLQQIAGMINQDIEHTGYRIVLKDLRYGIDTASMEDEREIEKKILAECFDAIRECALFVLLLGDRYGSVFEDLTVPYSYMPGQDLAGKSVTHLEVEYGIAQIGKERMLIFEREFHGDTAELPAHFRESEYGAEQNRKLKERLREEGYFFGSYTAGMKQGQFQVDEPIFLRYGWGFLSSLVKNYIDQQNAISQENRDLSEVLSQTLQELVEKKVLCYPECCRDTAKALILLRIQELLHQHDYNEINQLNAGGKGILQYRSDLVNAMPEDFVGLVREVCGCIASIVEPSIDVFSLLQALACAQKTDLSQLGGISPGKLMRIVRGEPLPQSVGFVSFDRFATDADERDNTGDNQRAFSYFQGKQPLLNHNDSGYLFLDENIASLLADACSEELQDRFWAYLASVFWYLPEPVKIWVHLLESKRYSLCISCLNYVQMDERFLIAVMDYAEAGRINGDFFNQMEDFLEWAIARNLEEGWIRYLLEICGAVIGTMDTMDSDEYYQTLLVPLYKRIHDRFYEAHKQDLTLSKLELLQRLYCDFEMELPEHPESVLSQEQQEELEALEDALSILDYGYDEPEEYTRMIQTFEKYKEAPETLLAYIRTHSVPYGMSGTELFSVLAQMVFEDRVWDEEALLRVFRTVFFCHMDEDKLLDAIKKAVENLVEPAWEQGNRELSISLLHILNDQVDKEIHLRRCSWFKWIYSFRYELMDEIARSTGDPVAIEIMESYDGVGFVEYEELKELDDQLLQEAENWYT